MNNKIRAVVNISLMLSMVNTSYAGIFESMFGSSQAAKSEPAPAASSSMFAPPPANSQLQQDYNAFFDQVPVGTQVQVGGGTVTKNADGTATYTNSSGANYNYNKNTPMSEVAKNAPGMGAAWSQAYTPQGAPAPTPATAPAGASDALASASGASQMQKDYNAFFDKVATGTVVEVGGGTVTKNADGTATYRNSSGVTYTYNKNTPMSEVAKNAPGMGAAWSQAYTPQGSTVVAATKPQATIPAKMQSDYNSFFTDVPAGTVVEVGGGTVTKNADGTATYRNSSGAVYTYNKNTPMSEVAKNAPGMGASWAKAYNYEAPVATTGTSTTVPSNLQSDYERFFTDVPAGTVVEVGGGTVTKNADGTATYKNSSGYSYTYSKSTPISEVAKNAPGMATSWHKNYNYQSPAVETPFNSLEEFIKWENDLKKNAQFNPNYQVPDYIRIAFMTGGPESAQGRYLFLKNNPQYAQDYANIHQGKLSQQTTDGSTIIKSNINNMPPEIAAYYKENPDALLASEGFGTDPVLTRMLYTGEIQLPNNINKTEWLRTHAWTPNGVVEQNNTLAYANAGYRGISGDGGYLLNRYDPNTGKIIEKPEWEGLPGITTAPDQGAAVRGATPTSGYSSNSGVVKSTPIPPPATGTVSTVYPTPNTTGTVSTVYPTPNTSTPSRSVAQTEQTNQDSAVLKNDIIMTGVVYSENPGLAKTVGDPTQSYSAVMLAQNAMLGSSALVAADKFQGKLTESIIKKCNNGAGAQNSGLGGTYQLYSQSCIIYELITSATGLFKEMDEIEKQIIEDQKSLTQAGKEANDRDAKIKAEKKKMEETNSKIKSAITALKAAKDAQKKAQEALTKATAALATASATTCPEDDDGSCASAKAQAVEAATKAVEAAKKELEAAEKKLKSATTKLADLLVEKFGNETSAVLALLTGTMRGDTAAGSVEFQVAGSDFSLINLGSVIGSLTGTSADRAEELIGGKAAESGTQDYFEKLVANFESGIKDENGRGGSTSSSSSSSSSSGVVGVTGPTGDSLAEVLDVFANMADGDSYLENIALAVSEYSANASNKQIELLEASKTPDSRAGQAAAKSEEKKALLENYKKMVDQILKTLDQNLSLFKTFYTSVKASNPGEQIAAALYYEYLLKFSTAQMKTKLSEGYFSKVDYVGIQSTHDCYNSPTASTSCK